MNPSYEQLKAELTETKRKLSETTELLQLALAEIANLKEKLKLNSKNSSKPPSTDQKSNTPFKDRKKRQARKGFSRIAFPPERIDKNIECFCENCPHCGSQSIQCVETPKALQQVELPDVRAMVTEFLLHKYHCNACGKRSLADLPKGVPDSSFGPRLMGLFTTLTGVLHVAKREAIQLVKELYDVDISLGSAPNIEERVARALDSVYCRIHSLGI